MKSIRVILLPAALCLLLTGYGKAQEVYRLDLETSIGIARLQSHTMQILQQQVKQASHNLKAATSTLRTHVDLDMTLPRYTETIRQWEDSLGLSYYSVRQNEVSGYLTINQPLPTDGRLYIRSGFQNFLDYNYENRLSQVSSDIGFLQPLDAFYGNNNNRLAYKRAKLDYDLSLKQLKRSELDLVYQISSIFYNLLSNKERLKIAQMTLDRQTEAFNIAKNKFDAGLIREVEALQMEVDLGEAVNNLDIARVNYTSQLGLLKEVLGLSLADSVSLVSELKYDEVIVDPEIAVGLAMENRLELKENEIRIELSEMELKRQKAAGRISGDIMLNYQFIGTDKSGLNVPYDEALTDSWKNLSDRPGNFGVALTLSVPIIDWGENRARVRAAQAGLQQNLIRLDGEKVTIEREIRSTVDRINSSLKRLRLLEKNVNVAEKSFEITRQRYANGEIDSQAMALERERLNNAYISRLESFINYKLLLSDLMRMTFYDFEKDRSVLDL